jgi:hypothetical protein
MDGTAEKATTGAPTGLAQRLWQDAEAKVEGVYSAAKGEGAALRGQFDYAVHNPGAAAAATLHGLEIVAGAVVVAVIAKEGGSKLLEAAPKAMEAAPKFFEMAGKVPEFLAESLKIGDFGPRLAFEGAYNNAELGAIGRQSKSTGYLGEMGNKLLGALKPAAIESNQPMMMADSGGLGGGADRSVKIRDLVNKVGEAVREFTHPGDRTTVQIAKNSGKVGIRFPDGAVRQLDMDTQINRIEVAENNGIKQYHFNGSRTPNLLIDSGKRYVEAGLHNGDTQFVLDTPGGNLDFPHGDNSLTRFRPGRMEIQSPDGKTRVANLPAIPDHVQITEHVGGGKTFQLAENGQQDYSMKVRLESDRPAPPQPQPRPSQPMSAASIGQRHAVKPGEGGASFAPIRNNRLVPPAAEDTSFNPGARQTEFGSGSAPNRPGAAGGRTPPPGGRPPFTPGGRTPFPPGGGGPPSNPFESTEAYRAASSRPSFETGPVTKHVAHYGNLGSVESGEDVVDDRYPMWRLNVSHNADRTIGDALTGIDSRAHINMHRPAEVAVGQMELPWFMEDFFNNLGRH